MARRAMHQRKRDENLHQAWERSHIPSWTMKMAYDKTAKAGHVLYDNPGTIAAGTATILTGGIVSDAVFDIRNPVSYTGGAGASTLIGLASGGIGNGIEDFVLHLKIAAAAFISGYGVNKAEKLLTPVFATAKEGIFGGSMKIHMIQQHGDREQHQHTATCGCHHHAAISSSNNDQHFEHV